MYYYFIEDFFAVALVSPLNCFVLLFKEVKKMIWFSEGNLFILNQIIVLDDCCVPTDIYVHLHSGQFRFFFTRLCNSVSN